MGWFAPTYKYLDPQFDELGEFFEESDHIQVNRADRRIFYKHKRRTSIDFWSCDKPDPGRGRRYKLVVIDEASLIRNFKKIWEESIYPTLADYNGVAWILGTPKGQGNFFHTMYKRGRSLDEMWKDWKSFRRGTIHNPHIPESFSIEAKKQLPPDVYDQEIKGIPADDGGNPFGLAAIAACFNPNMLVTDTKVYAYGVDVASKQDFTWIVGCNRAGQVIVSERFQLDWPSTKRRIIKVCGYTPTLVDETGVGDPVIGDLMEYGRNYSGFRFSNSSKQTIMTGVRNDIQEGQIEFSDPQLKDELDSFTYDFKNGLIFYGAPEGLHDDGVCALALCRQLVRQGPSVGALQPGSLQTRQSGIKT